MTEQELTDFNARLMQLEVGQTNMQMELRANTRLTNGLQEDMTEVLGRTDNIIGLQESVGEVLTIVGTIKSSMKFVELLGGVVKWTASIATAAGALWAAFHHSGPK